MQFWDNEGIEAIGSYLGVPLYVDGPTATGFRLTFARICVEINPFISLPYFITIDSNDGNQILEKKNAKPFFLPFKTASSKKKKTSTDDKRKKNLVEESKPQEFSENRFEILNVCEEEIDTELPTVEANSSESEPGQNLHSHWLLVPSRKIVSIFPSHSGPKDYLPPIYGCFLHRT